MDQTCFLMDPSRIHFRWATLGSPDSFFFFGIIRIWILEPRRMNPLNSILVFWLKIFLFLIPTVLGYWYLSIQSNASIRSQNNNGLKWKLRHHRSFLASDDTRPTENKGYCLADWSCLSMENSIGAILGSHLNPRQFLWSLVLLQPVREVNGGLESPNKSRAIIRWGNLEKKDLDQPFPLWLSRLRTQRLRSLCGCGFKPWPCSVGEGSGIATSCSRYGSDLVLPWLRRRPAAAAMIPPLAWEFP